MMIKNKINGIFISIYNNLFDNSPFLKLQCHSLCFHCTYRSSNVYVNCYQIFWCIHFLVVCLQNYYEMYSSPILSFLLIKEKKIICGPVFFQLSRFIRVLESVLLQEEKNVSSLIPGGWVSAQGRGLVLDIMALQSGWERTWTRISDFICTLWMLRKEWCWWSA